MKVVSGDRFSMASVSLFLRVSNVAASHAISKSRIVF